MHIEIPLQGQEAPLHFDTVDEVDEWIQSEAKFWGWLEKIPPQHQLQSLWNLPNKYWNRTRQLIQNYKADPDNAKEKRIEEIISGVSNIYNQHQAILSTSPKAHFIDILRLKNADEAAFALLSFLKPNEIPTNVPLAMRGVLQAFLFEHGLSSDTASAEKEALRTVSENWSAIINSAGKEHSEYCRMRTEAANDFATLIKSETAECEAIRNTAADKFKTLEHTFREKLALLAPVTYWKEKATKHRNVSIALGIAFLAMGGVTASLVWMALQHFVIGQMPNSSNASASVPQPEYWRFTIPVAIATFLIWPMRILARMLFSNLHLREDAMERVTMANTYLALSQAKEGLKDEDRKLILEMLFRPSSTGIVHDDASPPSILNYLSKAGSGRH